ncbi:MAG: DUF357 domain-containing protein [Candidatus Thermoplasmatota archaeon]
MDDKTRVEKDIKMFEENIEQLKKEKPSHIHEKVVELAVQYYEDGKYYYDKKDYFTAFGCINYAHGLLDGVLKY